MTAAAPVLLEHASLPSLAGVYARLATRQITTRLGRAAPSDLRRVSARVKGVEIDRDRLARYVQVCGLPAASTLPMTYPQVLGSGLGASLLLAPGVRLPGLGVVHVATRIHERRALGVDETLDVLCRVGESRPSDRGLEVDLVTEVSAGGSIAWEGVATLLWRKPHEPRTHAAAAPPPPGPRQRIVVPGDTGRRYARVSGDVNPIHMWAITAMPFGFPRPIAQGLWLVARSLGELAPSLPPPPRRLEVRFERPVLMPGEVLLTSEISSGAAEFALLTANETKIHLTGRIEAA
jgi:acyl dehydratase